VCDNFDFADELVQARATAVTVGQGAYPQK
jgi:hypothetical protein